MASRGSILYFKSLALVAIGLLWGIFLANGGVKALLSAVWHKKFSDGTPLRTVYSGFLPLDFLISILVGFFYYGTDGHDEGYHAFLVTAYSALQPAFVWLYAEAVRPGPKPYWVERPIVFGILWQCFGGAISLPLYFAAHLPWATSSSVPPVCDEEQALAIPWSFLIGAVLPAIVGMGAPWSGLPARASDVHQMILGVWQPDPIWVSGIQIVISWAIGALKSLSPHNSSQADRRAAGWIRFAYLLAATASSFGHLNTIRLIATGSNEKISFVRMFVPWPLSQLSGEHEHVLVYGPWLFLQYDYIIIGLSSVSWAYCLLRGNTSLRTRMSPGTLALALLLSSVAIGPGTTVSLALWYRETELLKMKKS